MLRVLVVLPYHGGSLPIGRYCEEALTELGCLAEVFDTPSFYPSQKALQAMHIADSRVEFLESIFMGFVNQCLEAKIATFQPDFILFLAQAPVTTQLLDRLRKEGIPTAMWFVEDYKMFTYWKKYAPYFDIFAIIQKEPFFEYLIALDAKNILYLPLAAQLTKHKPVELSEEEKAEYGSDISFVGAGYHNRRDTFLQLDNTSFKIWGSDWGENPGIKKLLQREGERIDPEEYVKIFNATTVNLNLHSAKSQSIFFELGDFVNPRTFEIAATGAFQLVSQRKLLPELFEEDEIACFSSLAELKEKIAYYLVHPEERKVIAEKSQKRVIKEHQYVHRMKQLLDFAQSVIPNFGEKSDSMEEVSESLRQELKDIIEEGKLPVKATFDDIVTVVKSKTGELTELETALLFLEEWKKLYTKE